MQRDRQCPTCGADEWRHRKGKGYDCIPCRVAHLNALSKAPEFQIWKRAKQRARRANVPFTLKATDIVIPKLCPVLGIPLKVGVGRPTQQSPSLDRIDPALGYVPGNVCVISNRANTIKSDATASELRAVLAWVQDRKLEVFNGKGRQLSTGE